MAHAETATGGTTTRPGRTAQAPASASASASTSTSTSAPDVFGPRTHLVAKWALPVLLGLIYGWWAAANRRHGTEITGWNLLFGWLTVLVFVVLYAVVRAVAARLRREQHALLWAVFTGCAVGFLINQSGRSVLQSAGISVAVAAGVFLTLFYRYYTHEDGPGRRLP